MKKNNVLMLWFVPLVLSVTAGHLEGMTVNLPEARIGVVPEPPMTSARLEEILRRLEPGVKGEEGQWEMVRHGVPLLISADTSHNRMLIIAPAADAKDVGRDTLLRMVEANFVSALDARYALFKGIIWAAFVYPLDSLRERDLLSAVQQVVTLVKTTGTTYSSSELQLDVLSYQGEGE